MSEKGSSYLESALGDSGDSGKWTGDSGVETVKSGLENGL